MLCVFSYVAAGQDQKKTSAALSHLQQQHQPQQQQHKSSPQQSHRQIQQVPQQIVHKEQSPKIQVIKTNIQPQKPILTTTATTVQPAPIKSPSVPKPTPNPPTRPAPQTSVDATQKGKLPQVPPRLPSQSSINRGPPPVIPPRPVRSGSVQQPPSSSSGRVLVRQQSATSMPMCTPQPPPKFVIPQRQNSKTSLTRSGSVSNQGSPSTPRRH